MHLAGCVDNSITVNPWSSAGENFYDFFDFILKGLDYVRLPNIVSLKFYIIKHFMIMSLCFSYGYTTCVHLCENNQSVYLKLHLSIMHEHCINKQCLKISAHPCEKWMKLWITSHCSYDYMGPWYDNVWKSILEV